MKVFPGIISFIAEHFVLEFTCFPSSDSYGNITSPPEGESNGIRTYFGSQMSTYWYPNGSEIYNEPDEECFEEEEEQYFLDNLVFNCPFFDESQSWTDIFQKIECNEQTIVAYKETLLGWLENIYQHQCEQSKSLNNYNMTMI